MTRSPRLLILLPVVALVACGGNKEQPTAAKPDAPCFITGTAQKLCGFDAVTYCEMKRNQYEETIAENEPGAVDNDPDLYESATRSMRACDAADKWAAAQ